MYVLNLFFNRYGKLFIYSKQLLMEFLYLYV